MGDELTIASCLTENILLLLKDDIGWEPQQQSIKASHQDQIKELEVAYQWQHTTGEQIHSLKAKCIELLVKVVLHQKL